jgi:hypothetical protein
VTVGVLLYRVLDVGLLLALFVWAWIGGTSWGALALAAVLYAEAVNARRRAAAATAALLVLGREVDADRQRMTGCLEGLDRCLVALAARLRLDARPRPRTTDPQAVETRVGHA